MEKTLVILKPSAIGRGIAGEVISRFTNKGLIIAGMKMIQLTDELLDEHYAHLADRPFFNRIKTSMKGQRLYIGDHPVNLNSCELRSAY